MRGGFKMILTPIELLQAHLYLFSTYELPTTRFITRFLQKDSIVVDIGANIGYVTMFCAKILENSGAVYAFEPQAENYKLLQQHIELNNFQNIVPQKFAVTSTPTTLRLYLATDNHGAHSTIFNADVMTENYEEVQGLTLDSFVEEKRFSKLDLVKIDVEGAEFEVLQGMQNVMRSFRPVIIVELNEMLQQQRGMSSNSIKSMLIEYGYTIFSPTEQGFLQNTASTPFENSICVPNEKITQLNNLLKK